MAVGENMASSKKIYLKKGLGPLTPKISISVEMLKSSVEKQQAPWAIDKGLNSLGVSFPDIATLLAHEVSPPPGLIEQTLRSKLGEAISEQIERVISSRDHRYTTHQLVCEGVEQALADDGRLSLIELIEKMPADVEVDIDQIENVFEVIDSFAFTIPGEKTTIDKNPDTILVNLIHLSKLKDKKAHINRALKFAHVTTSISPFPQRTALSEVLKIVDRLNSKKALETLIRCEKLVQKYKLDNGQTQEILRNLAQMALKKANQEENILSRSFNATVRTVKFSSDGIYLAAGSDDHSLHIWKTYDDGQTYVQMFNIKAHKREIKAIAFSPDGQVLVSAGEDEVVKFWNPQTGTLLYTLPRNHKHGIFSLAFRQDGLLVSGSWDKCINLWDSHQRATKRTLRGHKNPVWSLAFSPDGHILASGADDKTVRLWCPDTGELINVLEGHKHGVYALAFSPDGRILATGSWDQTIRLWDVGNGKCIKTLKGHKASVWQLRFTADNQYLISSADDTLINIWDLKTYALRLTLSGHRNGVYGIDISPIQSMLASGSWDQTVRLWNVALED